MAQTKRQKAIREAVQPGKAYVIDEALKIVKTATKAKFVEAVDVAVRLGLRVTDGLRRGRGRVADHLVAMVKDVLRVVDLPGKCVPDVVQQLEDIAKAKEPDLTAADLDAAVRTIAGSARSMGLTVEG